MQSSLIQVKQHLMYKNPVESTLFLFPFKLIVMNLGGRFKKKCMVGFTSS